MQNIGVDSDIKINISEVNKIIDKFIGHSGALIAILQAVQEKYSYLPRTALEQISRRLQIPMTQIFHVSTFYKTFSLHPRGKHLTTVCLGTACHVRGAQKIAGEFEKQLDIKSGETTADKEFTLETVNCVGACALGPVVIVDGKYFPHSTKEEVKEIIDKNREGLGEVDFKSDQRIFPLEVFCPHCNQSLMDQDHPIDGIPSIRVMISYRNKLGWVRLSSFYGSYNVETEYDVPPDTIVNFFCPHCNAELIGTTDCVECDAPMVQMMVKGGGNVQTCTRRGCKGHMLDLSHIKYP